MHEINVATSNESIPDFINSDYYKKLNKISFSGEKMVKTKEGQSGKFFFFD